jgi:hypothetical protein
MKKQALIARPRNAACWSRRVALLAVCASAGCASVSEGPARVEPGVQVRVEVPERPPGQFRGEVVAIEADTLTLRYVGSSDIVDPIPLAYVTRVEVRRGTKGNAGTGALAGGLLGIALGVVAVASEDSSSGWYEGAGWDIAAVGTMGLLGAGLGALIGAAARTEVWQEVPLETIRIEPAGRGAVVTFRVEGGP